MKKLLLIVLLPLVVLGIAAGVGMWEVRHPADSKLLIREETIFMLEAGMGRSALGEQLYTDKATSRPRMSQWLLCVEPELSHLKAGVYRFTPDMTVRNMLQLLESGKETQFPLCPVEEMHLNDYLKQLCDAPRVRHTLSDGSYKAVAEALKLENSQWAEGWSWLDTWMYTADTTDVALLKRMHQRMVKTVDTVWEGRADGPPYQDKNQLVTMVSTTKKETAAAGERNQVVSVFTNCLYIGMRSQTDPTVVYEMGTRYNGKLPHVDLDTPTAYNTYTITGLSPGPTATSGGALLQATAYPAKASYLYFVADGKNGHTFNTNLTSHDRSVQDYLKVFKEKNGQQLYRHRRLGRHRKNHRA